MPELWFPAAVRDPGLNAGYRRGRTIRQLVKEHFTVGLDSRAIIRGKGLATFLFPKVGPPIQFAPVDAVCSDSCEWCITGPGREFERLGRGVGDCEPLTADQILWGGRVAVWLHEQWGYPLTLYSGARLPIGDQHRGFVNHASLVHRACDQHFDGDTQAEFAAQLAAAGGAAPPLPPASRPREDSAMLKYGKDGKDKRTHEPIVQSDGSVDVITVYKDQGNIVGARAKVAPAGTCAPAARVEGRDDLADLAGPPLGGIRWDIPTVDGRLLVIEVKYPEGSGWTSKVVPA